MGFQKGKEKNDNKELGDCMLHHFTVIEAFYQI